ncbi:hypothetical protein HDU98_009553 [Podochytrium sp. JEL0797]|nr:hypothetical protein HDU98_009553 [Podochytrium sp. JEL0797]
MGDSAGGGLCMSLLTYLKTYLKSTTGEPMLPLPGAVVLFSPWVDLSYKNASWKENAGVDWLPERVVSLHDPVVPKTEENPNGVDNPVYMYILGNSKQRVLPYIGQSSIKFKEQQGNESVAKSAKEDTAAVATVQIRH